jgi:hypothetical protein
MTNELLEQLELVDVIFEDNKKCTLVFLHEERGEIREVNFNKQVYDKDTKKFIDDDEKAQKCEEWAQEYFGLEFDRLAEAIGERKDIYSYDNFNSLFEVQMVTKFEDDMLGQVFETEVTNAFDDGKKIAIHFEYEGNLYESKMQYADYVEARKEWFINPIKQKKQYDKFEDKFQMPVTEIENMIGKTVLVEVKKAMGKWIYSEIKPFKKPKKEKGA